MVDTLFVVIALLTDMATNKRADGRTIFGIFCVPTLAWLLLALFDAVLATP
jgi:hypothetical protein